MCRVSFEPCLNTIGSKLDANLCGKRDFIKILYLKAILTSQLKIILEIVLKIGKKGFLYANCLNAQDVVSR